MNTPTRTGQDALPERIIYSGHELRVFEFADWAGRDVAVRPLNVFELPEVARRWNSHAALVAALEACVSLLEYLPNEYVHRETGEPISYSPDGALAQARAALAAARNG